MFTDLKFLKSLIGKKRRIMIEAGSSFQKTCQILPMVTVMAAVFLLTGCAAFNSKPNHAFPSLDTQMRAVTKPISENESRVDRAKFAMTTDNASQIGRYVTVNNDATRAQVNPLLAVSTFTFNPSVATVGEAVNQVLENTGYQLAPKLSISVKQTLAKPLPITNRHLGPLSIQSTLEVLMGEEVFTLQRDPLHRLVNFKVKPSIAKALGVKDE